MNVNLDESERETSMVKNSKSVLIQTLYIITYYIIVRINDSRVQLEIGKWNNSIEKPYTTDKRIIYIIC